MTSEARFVLEDCRKALGDLINHQNSVDEFRRYWFMTVTLLQTVEEVLIKKCENSKTDEAVKKAIDKVSKLVKADKMKHKIYHYFIKIERNNVIHQYMSGISTGPNIHSPYKEFSLNRETKSEEEPTGYVDYTHIYMGKSSMGEKSPYQGMDPLIIVEEAIQWWEDRLNEIDSLAQNPSSSTS